MQAGGFGCFLTGICPLQFVAQPAGMTSNPNSGISVLFAKEGERSDEVVVLWQGARALLRFLFNIWCGWQSKAKRCTTFEIILRPDLSLMSFNDLF